MEEEDFTLRALTRADSAGTARWRRGRPGNRPHPVASNVGVLIFFEQPDQITSDSRRRVNQARSGGWGAVASLSVY